MSAIDENTKLQGQQTLLTPEQVSRLQEEEGNVFMEYTYDKVDRVLEMDEVEEALRHVMQRYQQERQRTGESDAKIRDLLLTDEKIEAFSRSHPTIFRKMTDRSTPPRVVETLCGMMGLRQRQEQGQLGEAEAAGALEMYLKNQISADAKEAKGGGDVSSKK